MKHLECIDHIAIQVENIQESITWYSQRFNCKILYSDNTWGFIKFKNIKLALVTKDKHPPHIAIIDKNVTLSNGAVEHRDGSISKYINDLDNNSIELIKY